MTLRSRQKLYMYNQDKFTDERNVLVVYLDTDPRAKEVAEYYQVARRVPEDNMVEMPRYWPGTQTNLLLADAKAAVQFIKSTADNAKWPVKYILFVGDYPTSVAGVKSLGVDLSFYDMFRAPEYFLGINSGGIFDIATQNDEDKSIGWTNSKGNYPAGVPGVRWPGLREDSLDDPWQSDMSPYYLPKKTEKHQYTPFCIPLGNYPDAVEVAKKRIDETIEAEELLYEDFGDVILSEGSSTNPVIIPFYAEVAGEGVPFKSLHWTGLDLVQESGLGYYDRSIQDNDPNNYASTTPGITGFGTPEDLFFNIRGQIAYFSRLEGAVPERLGDYSYRKGAIALWAQSYGANPSSERSVDWYEAPIALEVLPTTTEEGDRVHIRASDAIGVYVNAFRLDNLRKDGLSDIEVTSTKIIIRHSGVVEFEVDYQAITGYEGLYAALLAGKTSDWKITIIDGSHRPSRCLSSWRSGSCIAIGTTREPFATGDPVSVGLATALWYGFSIGEWHKMVSSGRLDTNTVRAQRVSWRQNIIYGDPLYRPFGHKAFALPFNTPHMIDDTTDN